MEKNVVIYIIVGIVALVALSSAIYIRSKYRRPTDYRALFYLGFLWIAIGLAGNSLVFGIVGLMFLIVGYRHRKKWEENRFRWSKLSVTERNIKIGVLTTMALGFVAGLMVYYG